MVRHAGVADAAMIARIHVETWRVAYRDLLPAEHLASLSIERREQVWRERLADPAGRAVLVVDDVGFAEIGPSRDADATSTTSELYAIYVDAARWNGGHGRALCAAALAVAASRGATRVTLWVLERNTRARAFYERMGFVADGVRKDARIGGAEVVELRYATEP